MLVSHTAPPCAGWTSTVRVRVRVPAAHGTPQVLQVTYPPSWTASVLLAVSLTRQSQPVPLTAPFAAGSQLQLGLEGLLPALIPMPATAGLAQLTVDPWNQVGVISGRPFYLQAAVFDGLGAAHLSPLSMIIFH